MLKSYEAIYEKGQIRWLKDAPDVDSATVIITFLDEKSEIKIKRKPPVSISGKGKALGNLINPIVNEKDWNE